MRTEDLWIMPLICLPMILITILWYVLGKRKEKKFSDFYQKEQYINLKKKIFNLKENRISLKVLGISAVVLTIVYIILYTREYRTLSYHFGHITGFACLWLTGNAVFYGFVAALKLKSNRERYIRDFLIDLYNCAEITEGVSFYLDSWTHGLFIPREGNNYIKSFKRYLMSNDRSDIITVIDAKYIIKTRSRWEHIK